MRTVSFFVSLLLALNSHARQALMLEPGIISTGGEFGFTLSPDARTAFWVKSNGKRDSLVILWSQWQDGKWSVPDMAPFSGKPGIWSDIDPIFSPDGEMVLFQSDRPVPGKPEREGFDIWASRKTKTGWGEAVHLGNVVNGNESESYASITNQGHIYFMKQADGEPGNSEIFVARNVNGQYAAPVNLGPPVNTRAFRESNPFISANEDFLLYFSTDSIGYGAADLYISFNEKGKWSKPVNLGNIINTSEAEFCPFYHAGQKRLYYSRQSKHGDRMKEDIFYINFDPETYRKKRD